MRTQSLVIILLFIACQFLPKIALSADIRVQLVVSERQLILGEQFQVTVQVQSTESVNVQRPQFPNVEGLHLQSRTPSTRTSYSLVNNQATMTYSYSFVVTATRDGLIEIPPVPVLVNGQQFMTEQVSLDVFPRSRQDEMRATQRPEIYLVKELSDENLVTGQQIIVDVTLYFRDNIEINSYQVTRGWTTEGFWQEDLSAAHSARAETIFLDGVRYRRAVLVRHAVFPTRSGRLTLNPYHIRASVRASTRGFDTHGSLFAQGFGRTQNVDLQTEEISVSVSPIPRAEYGHFINAVGDLSIRRYISEETVAIGESIEIITEISGRGNHNLISRPRYNLPEDFDVFRPQETIDIEKTATHIQGTKEFRDIMIARRVGAFTIPADTLTYFDDNLGQVVKVELPELHVRVTRDPNARIGFVSSGEISMNPMTGLASWRISSEPQPFFTFWMKLFLLFPFLISALAFGLYQYRLKMATDQNFSRRKTAGRTASNKLQEAQSLLEQGLNKQVYGKIHSAIYGCIADRLGLPETGKSDKEIVSYLRVVQASQKLVDDCHKMLDLCSGIRFAPTGTSEDVKADIGKARDIIECILKETAS